MDEQLETAGRPTFTSKKRCNFSISNHKTKLAEVHANFTGIKNAKYSNKELKK